MAPSKKRAKALQKSRGIVPLPKPTPHKVLELELDPSNPRLTTEQRTDRSELMRFMIEEFDVREIAESIVVSGFLPYDPIIGVKEKGKVVILEGNRRVAAVQMLLDNELVPDEYKEQWEALSEELDDTSKKALRDKFPVVIVGSREDPLVRSYIGFRHVTGPLTWPAEQKAAYITMLTEKPYEWDYDTIAERMGHRSGTIEKHFVAYRIIQQAKRDNVDGATQMEHSFGVLMRALQAGGVADFIGVSYPNDPKESKWPVPAEKMDNFKLFVRKTFVPLESTGRPFVEESRKLTEWGQILRSSRAVEYVKREEQPDFDHAWRLSEGPAKSVASSLNAAAIRLEEAAVGLQNEEPTDAIEAGVGACAKPFRALLQTFPAVAREHKIRLE